MEFLKEQFKKHRLQARWSLVKLSKVCGLSDSTLSRWETGTIVPSEANIRMLANVLNISISEISDCPKSTSLENEIKGKTNIVHTLSETNNLEFATKEKEIILGIKEQSSKLRTASLIINALINSMESAFYIKNTDNKYIIANNAFLKLVQKSNFSNIEGLDDYDFFPKNEAEENTKADKNVLDQQKKFVDEETYIPGTRKKRWGLITRAPIFNNDNKIEGIVCTIKDITEQQKLRKMIGHMVAESEMCLSIIEEDTQKILYVNNESSNIFGARSAKEYNKLWEDWLNNIVHPDDKEEQRQYLKEGKFPKNRIYRIIHPQRGIRYIKAQISEPTSFFNRKCKVTITRDVTDEFNVSQED